MPEPLREYLLKLRVTATEKQPQSEAENEELRVLRTEAAQFLLDRKDATSIISSLLEKNGDLDTLTATCGRPLLSIAAVHAESAPSVELLLAFKADVHTAARDGREPLHYACGRGDTSLVRRLLAKMANPNSTCELGRTPADEAILTARDGLAQDVCRVLREAGLYEDDRDRKKWVTRSLKDSNEDAWRADHEDIELYPIPGR
jgi:ankyrin repeat protein